MPWKEETKMSIKKNFIASVLKEPDNFSKICKEFQISRVCGYKWLKRFKEHGPNGLIERSKRPLSSPLKTPQTIENKFLKVRQEHPAWGGRKILAYLSQRGYTDLPHASTVTRILHRHGKISQKASLARQSFIRFEHALPNQLWQMDFKGHFALGIGRCYPLTILDDCSRYSLALEACKNQQELTVKNVLINVFRQYGLPEKITMDNGAPWGHSYGPIGYTSLEVWLIRLGIITSHSRPYHPQTQGKDERFHMTLDEELLENKIFIDLEDAQKEFNLWRQMYNEERPHEALQMEVPAKRYSESQRQYPETLPPIEYGLGARVKTVTGKGYINYKGHRYFISESMIDLPVELIESNRDGIVEVYLGPKKIREIDLINKISARKIERNV
jgi:transposase InsO family protein